MARHAYRFVPLIDTGGAQRRAVYFLVSDHVLRVGDEVDQEGLGHGRWRVVELRPDEGMAAHVTDADGCSLPIIGTLVCEGMDHDSYEASE